MGNQIENMNWTSDYSLPDNIRGRNLYSKVIPTVCNLENMLVKLQKVKGDFAQLKPWEKRSYKSYQIGLVVNKILMSPRSDWTNIIREHILLRRPSDFGASVIDIYLVAYVAETFGEGREVFFRYVNDAGISDKANSAQAIWQVGKGDGVYLGILYDDGKVKDWDFMMQWVKGTNNL